MTTTTTEERDDLIRLARQSLANRLHGLARRVDQMDPQALADMHGHLDEFRTTQRERRDTETA